MHITKAPSGHKDKSDLDFKAWTIFRAQLSSLTRTEMLILIKSVSVAVSPESQKSLGPLSAKLPLTSFAIPSSFSIPPLSLPTMQYSKSYTLKFKVLLNSVTFPCLSCHHLSPSGSHIIITWRAFTTFQWFPSTLRLETTCLRWHHGPGGLGLAGLSSRPWGASPTLSIPSFCS